MSTSTKQKAVLSYADVVRSMNSQDIQGDLTTACEQLASTGVHLLESYEFIAMQLHTVDLLGLASPLRPQWSSLRKEFRDLLWHFRSNAGIISSRLKMFCTVVLPLATRNSSSSRSHDEKLQVLTSFMGISADHATLTRNLVGSAMKFSNSLNTFHTEFLKFASQRASASRGELRELSQKLTEFENNIRHLFQANGKYSSPDVAHFAFSIYRTCGTSKRQSTRAKASYQRLPLTTPELVTIGRLYEQLDFTRNEVAHAQYTAQVCHRKTDAITTAQTTMSTLVLDQLTAFESGLSLFLSVWSRLQLDCNDILRWLQNPRSFSETPGVLVASLDGGYTLYATVADALDTFVMGIDPSHFAKS